MIRISHSYIELYEMVSDPRYTDGVDRNLRDQVRSASAARAHEAGLRRINCSAAGGKLVTPNGIFERRQLYAITPPGEAQDAARQAVDAIAAEHGPGDLWSIGPVVDLAADDGRVPCGTIDGVEHILLRAYYFHDPARAAPSLADVSS